MCLEDDRVGWIQGSTKNINVLIACLEDDWVGWVQGSSTAAAVRSSTYHRPRYFRQRVRFCHSQKQSHAEVLHLLLPNGNVHRRHSGPLRRPAAHLDRSADVGRLQKSVKLVVQDEQRRRLYGMSSACILIAVNTRLKSCFHYDSALRCVAWRERRR